MLVENFFGCFTRGKADRRDRNMCETELEQLLRHCAQSDPIEARRAEVCKSVAATVKTIVRCVPAGPERVAAMDKLREALTLSYTAINKP